MQVRQVSSTHTQAQHTNAAGVFAGAALIHSPAIRTATLLATILLVAFALYMTGPSGEAAGEKGASIHMTSSTSPDAHAEAQQEDDSAGQSANSKSSNNSSVHNEITVNGKSISVPDNGSIHKTVTDGDTTTTIDVSNNSTSTTVSSNNVSVQSSSGSESQEP